MGTSAAIVSAVAGAYSAYNSAEQGRKQQSAAKKQQAQANYQASLAEQDMNRANRKQPDTNALLSAAQQSGRAGASGTMLTGAAGIDPSSLTLGRNTLLGQ